MSGLKGCGCQFDGKVGISNLSNQLQDVEYFDFGSMSEKKRQKQLRKTFHNVPTEAADADDRVSNSLNINFNLYALIISRFPDVGLLSRPICRIISTSKEN